MNKKRKPPVGYLMICLLTIGLALIISSCENGGHPSGDANSHENSPSVNQPAYLMAYFRSGPGQTDMSRKLYYAFSRDALHWYELNNNEAVWSTPVGGQIIRDPFINKGPDGNYYLVHTMGASPGSPDAREKIGFAQSRDLITFTDARALTVMGSFNDVANSWAPEWSWDEANGRYVVYWSSTVGASKADNNRIYKAYTKDWKTFSPAQLMFDPGYSVIDANVTSYQGKFYMFFKDEADRPMRNRWAVSGSLDGKYGDISPLITPSTTEGPEVLKLVGQQKWYLYYDYWAAGKYGVMESSDMIHWSKELPASAVRFPYQRRHATFFPISEEELAKLINHFSLVAQYSMDNDDLTKLTDSTGKHDGTVAGAKWTKNGKLGGALSFEGKKDGAKLGNDLTGKQNSFALRTVSLWMKADRTKGTQVIYDEGDDKSGLALRLKDGMLQASAANQSQRMTAEAQLKDDEAWHHIAVVFSEGNLKLYIDGGLKDSKSAPFKSIASHSDGSSLGVRAGEDAFGDNGDGDGFEGMLDEVALYDTPLQDADVAYLFSHTKK